MKPKHGHKERVRKFSNKPTEAQLLEARAREMEALAKEAEDKKLARWYSGVVKETTLVVPEGGYIQFTIRDRKIDVYPYSWDVRTGYNAAGGDPFVVSVVSLGAPPSWVEMIIEELW
jgi:uncharacterized protein (DUF2236 family)